MCHFKVKSREGDEKCAILRLFKSREGAEKGVISRVAEFIQRNGSSVNEYGSLVG